MRKLFLLLLCTLVTESSANAADEYESHWKTINENLIQGGGTVYDGISSSVQKDECGVLSCEKVCYNRAGANIGLERCDKMWSWAKKNSFNKLRTVESKLGLESTCWALKKECLTNFENAHAKLKAAKSEIDNDATDDVKANLKEYYDAIHRKFDVAIQENGRKIDQINGSDKRIAKIKEKLNSKECKIYQVTSDICRKSYVEAAAKNGLAVEEEATKQSGVVNLYSRYKLGQMKALHGTGNLPQLKKEYRELVGSEWTPKTCEASPEVKRKIATGDMTDESEEIEACGCAGLDCNDLD